MGDVFNEIRRTVREETYLISNHADERLRERRIAHWQVVHGLQTGRLLAERPHRRPNPTVEVEQLLADGTAIKAVWALMEPSGFAKLVTVHFFDR